MEIILQNNPEAEATPEFVDHMRLLWDFTPPAVRSYFVDHKWSACVSLYPPDGFESAIALVYFDDKTLHYFEHTLTAEGMVRNERMNSVHYHELGHIFDLEEGCLADQKDFRAAYACDRTRLRPSDIKRFHHYLSYDRQEVTPDRNGHRDMVKCQSIARGEGFAQLFAEHIVAGAQLGIKEQYPQAQFPDPLRLTKLMPSSAALVAKMIEDRMPVLATPLAPFRPAIALRDESAARQIARGMGALKL